MSASVRNLGAAALFAAASLMFSAGAASSAEIAKLKIGNWSGGAFTNNNTGAFSHCAASARYKSGITLVFSISNNRQWSMGFSSPSWNFTQGTTYPVRYWVDDGQVLNGTALAKTQTLAQVFLPANSSLFVAFKGGQMLRVAAAQQTLSFRLTDTDALLSALLRCSRDYGNYRASSNPFGGGTAPAPANPFAGSGTPPAPANPFGGGTRPTPRVTGDTI